jgi:hypothetical protein
MAAIVWWLAQDNAGAHNRDVECRAIGAYAESPRPVKSLFSRS